jgi:tRNA pseudouridine38-40 synthase
MNASPTKKRFLFKFYYIGTKKFYGSQRQKENLSVEQCILEALINKKYIHDSKTSGFEVSSRTDRFVSARASAFSFISHKNPILMEINSILPKEIGLWAHCPVKINFSSRFNAITRHYKYIVPQPYSYLQERYSINLEIMKKACRQLQGRHDFINFSKRDKTQQNSVRDLDYIDFIVDNDLIIFDFKSRAFLRQQIRRMMKIILDLGFNNLEYDEFLKYLDPSNYYSFQPAEPEGLILWDINFDDNIKFIIDKKSIKRKDDYFFKQKIQYGLKNRLFIILHQNNTS